MTVFSHGLERWACYNFKDALSSTYGGIFKRLHTVATYFESFFSLTLRRFIFHDDKIINNCVYFGVAPGGVTQLKFFLIMSNSNG